jgi:hypothetical protein
MKKNELSVILKIIATLISSILAVLGDGDENTAKD